MILEIAGFKEFFKIEPTSLITFFSSICMLNGKASFIFCVKTSSFSTCLGRRDIWSISPFIIKIIGTIIKIRVIIKIIDAESAGEKYFLNFLSKGWKIKAKMPAPKKALKKGKPAYKIKINNIIMTISAISFLSFRYLKIIVFLRCMEFINTILVVSLKWLS